MAFFLQQEVHTIYIGEVLLDLKDPTKIIGKTSSPILSPHAVYEQHENCANTVFPCGGIIDYDQDRILLYYDATDSSICLAQDPY